MDRRSFVRCLRRPAIGLMLLCLMGCGGEPVEDSEPTPPQVPHAAPNEAPEALEMCVTCHACGVDGAPLIDRGHSICTECHGPPPEYAAEIKGDDPCGFKMDCEKDPPEVNCLTACHRHTIREINTMCEECHAYR